MAELTASTAICQVGLALKNTILLALGQRTGPAGANTPFADAPALRAHAPASTRHDELAFVTSKGVTYQFERFSTAPDDGDRVLAPTGAATGRWLKTASTVASGYARLVRAHAGEDGFATLLKRSAAARPAVHVVFGGVTSFSRSQTQGALYQNAARFTIKALASSLRAEGQAVDGSTAVGETDPGSHQIVGDVIAAVAGSSLGQPGVSYVEIGDVTYTEAPEEARLSIEALAVIVFYTVHQPDADAERIQLGALGLQRQRLGGGSPFDASNCVRSGYTVPLGAGYTKTPAPGTAYVNGALVSSTPPAFAFPANSDTYRDLHADGTFSYSSVPNGQPAPALVRVGDTLRVGVTVTDGIGVIYDALLAAALVDWQAVDVVPVS